MPDRNTRKLENAKQANIADINFYPSQVKEGELLFALPQNKALRIYKKIRGMLWWINFTKDGDFVVDRDLNVKRKARVNNNYVLEGYSSGRNILRVAYVKIEDGTNANTIKCTCTAYFNGDAITVTDNISKGSTTGNFTLDAGGTNLTIEASGLSGNCVGVLMGNILTNDTGTNLINNAWTTGNDVVLRFKNAVTDIAEDLTALVDVAPGSKIIRAGYIYITDN